MEVNLCSVNQPQHLSTTLIVAMGKVLPGPIGPLELVWQVRGRMAFDLRDLVLELPF